MLVSLVSPTLDELQNVYLILSQRDERKAELYSFIGECIMEITLNLIYSVRVELLADFALSFLFCVE